MNAGPILPWDIEALAGDVRDAALELEEAADICARNPVPANFDDMMTSMRATYEAIQQTFQKIRGDTPVTSIARIQSVVASHFGLCLSDMSSHSRLRRFARPRQVAMYLARQLTPRTLPEIGRSFGNRDHTTVMHAVSRIAKLVAEDEDFRERVEAVRGALVVEAAV